jgi:chemotaxis protein MotB
MSGQGNDGERPIIVIKKGRHAEHGHHGGAWKVAYADFVTAMMALFMVLWLVGQSPKTRSTVGAYFRDPLGLAGGGNTEYNRGPNSGGAGFFEGGNTAMSMEVAITSGRIDEEGHGKKKDDIIRLNQARDRLAQALMALRSDHWARHVELTATEEGLRIEIQDDDNESLFLSGSAKINPAAKNVLTAIAGEVGLMPNRVVIEGHTDATRTATSDDGNWPLSTQRANSARAFFVTNGLRRDQVASVEGYADQRLRLWHDPTNPRNRRVSMLVLLERGHRKALAEVPQNVEHPLVERLEDLDYQTQGPSDPIEIAPIGRRLPLTPGSGPAPGGPTPTPDAMPTPVVPTPDAAMSPAPAAPAAPPTPAPEATPAP